LSGLSGPSVPTLPGAGIMVAGLVLVVVAGICWSIYGGKR
jgi:hypothetical protein